MAYEPKGMPKTEKVSGTIDTITPTEKGWAGSFKANETQNSKKAK